LDTTTLRLDLKPGEPNSSVAVAATPEGDTPAGHARKGRQELSAGQIDIAASEFRVALNGDPGNVAAHRGLAEIYRRQGKLDEAVKELQASLQARDSAVVRVSLARIFLEQKKTDLARTEVERALKLAPNYAEAKQLLEHLQNGKPAEKKPVRGAQ
jgi:Tfp pilus assembly protein PilF